MEFFSQTYTALRGPTGAPQTAPVAIQKLTDRLSQSSLLPDRRAAVLALKGLVREHKREVGEMAFGGLIEVLLNDVDADDSGEMGVGRAVLECFISLCSTSLEQKEDNALAMKHTDYFLSNPIATHRLFSVLQDSTDFYTTYATLQLLAVLLANRRNVVQKYFISSPDNSAATGIVTALGNKKEIIRNETLPILSALTSTSLEIAKILAFGGAFDALLNIITNEGGVEGGVVVQDALGGLESLLRGSGSNLTYFSETHLPVLPTLLLFPPQQLSLESEYATPQEFALQFWNPQKIGIVTSIVNILSLFIKNTSSLSSALMRLLIEIGLASNAPAPIKIQALTSLASIAMPPTALATLVLTPYAPVEGSNGEEWDRLEHTSALSALVGTVLEGEYGESPMRSKDSLELRVAGVALFENFVRRDDVREAVLKGMKGGSDTPPPRASIQILTTLTSPPPQPLDHQFSTRILLGCLLFSALVSQGMPAKDVARTITPGGPKELGTENHARGGSVGFYVPADQQQQRTSESKPKLEDEDEEDSLTLLQITTEYLSLAFLLRSKMVDPLPGEDAGEEREWDRLLVGYLALLIRWLWDDPGAVKIFLEAKGLDILAEPINQPLSTDPLVKGLAAFLLGVCYEYNKDPTCSLSRSAIYQIINRLGQDTIITAMNKVRSEDRWRDLTPDACVTLIRSNQHVAPMTPATATTEMGGIGMVGEEDGEVWFDWSFLEFWKTNFYTIQRCIGLDPEALAASQANSGGSENTALINTLRSTIATQTTELEGLRRKVEELTASHEEQVTKRKEAEKEQEDLLVYLDEISSKRKRDKSRLRELGQEVSEDEEEGEEGDEDAEEDEG